MSYCSDLAGFLKILEHYLEVDRDRGDLGEGIKTSINYE